MAHHFFGAKSYRYEAFEEEELPFHPQEVSFGNQRAKDRFDRVNLFAVLTALGLLALGCAVVQPTFYLAWYLTSKQQLTVLGFVIAAQTQCLQRLYGKTFPLLEAIYGPSLLQNYNAILTNSPVGDHVSLPWRVIILGFTVIPFALSAGYKQFTGGVSYRTIQSPGHNYGATGPPGLSVGAGYGGSFLANLTAPFRSATANDTQMDPDTVEYPMALGFNHLLLSRQSSCFLDSPNPEAVLGMQGNLSENEGFELEARVRGWVVHHVPLNKERNDENFWANQSFPQFEKHGIQVAGGGLYFIDLYNYFRVGLYANLLGGPEGSNVEDHTWCMLSIQPAPLYEVYTDQTAAYEQAAFKQNAQLFNFVYQECQATWTITRSSIELKTGACDGQIVPWEATPHNLHNISLALQNWFLPALSEMLGMFTATRNESKWLIPTMVAAAGAMTYSRVASFMVNPYNVMAMRNGTTYFVQDILTSRRGILKNSAGLYIILITQPLLTLMLFIWSLRLYSAPLDSGFGLIAILAGVESKSLRYLRGAALSGSLSKAISLRIEVRKRSNRLEEQAAASIVYTINKPPRGKNGKSCGLAARTGRNSARPVPGQVIR